MHTKNKPPGAQANVNVPAPAKNAFLLFASPTFWLKAVMLAQMALLGLQFAPTISTNGDDAVYYILGKSLASGQGYHNIHLVHSPIATSYPIVFPAFLSITHFFTDTPLLAKILVMCLGLLVTLASWKLFKLYMPPYALPLIVLIGSSAVLNQHAIELLSEIPYVLLTLISLLLMEKSYREPHKKWLFWLTIVVSILPMNCRSIGMAFSAAFIAANCLNKHFKYALAHGAVLACGIVFFKMITSWNTPYVLQLFQVNSYDPEKGYATISEMISRVTANIATYSSQILPDALFPSFAAANPGVVKPLGIILSLLIGLGCLKTLLLPSRLVGLYIVFYCGILSLWQAQWSSGRFLAGIMPLLYYALFAGITLIWDATALLKHGAAAGVRACCTAPFSSLSKMRALVFWSMALVLAIDTTCAQVANCEKRKQLSADWANYNACADWIRVNTPQNAIVVSRKAELTFLRCHRQGMLYPFSRDKEKVLADIRKEGATHILLDNFFWTGTTQRYLYPALMAHPEFYRIVYGLKNPDTYVLEIVTK